MMYYNIACKFYWTETQTKIYQTYWPSERSVQYPPSVEYIVQYPTRIFSTPVLSVSKYFSSYPRIYIHRTIIFSINFFFFFELFIIILYPRLMQYYTLCIQMFQQCSIILILRARIKSSNFIFFIYRKIII